MWGQPARYISIRIEVYILNTIFLVLFNVVFGMPFNSHTGL